LDITTTTRSAESQAARAGTAYYLERLHKGLKGRSDKIDRRLSPKGPAVSSSSSSRERPGVRILWSDPRVVVRAEEVRDDYCGTQ